MIPKVVGYQGFQSYGDLTYPTLKPGKKTLNSNEIWQKTVREEDKESFYKNSNYHFTSKQIQMDTIVEPQNYKDAKRVKKVNQLSKQTDIEGVTSNDIFKRTGNSSMTPENPLLTTQIEHWQTNYQNSIVDPYSKNRAERAEWTYNKPPYVVETKVGPSEYKKTFGMIGENPRDKLNDLSETQPRTFDELRLGTSQQSMHIPGYTGFIPTIITNSKAMEHGNGNEVRKDFMKTNLKENYHTKIPGYAGHIPQAVANQRDAPRQSCFNT